MSLFRLFAEKATHLLALLDELDVLLPKIRNEPLQRTDRILFSFTAGNMPSECRVPVCE